MKVFFTLLLSSLLWSASAQKASLPCEINLGADVMVCNNAVFTLNPHPISDGTYAWSGSTGLSCYDCPAPIVSGLTTGIYTYFVTVTTPDCTASDTVQVTVINGDAPQYEIIENAGMCMGDSIALGGPEFPGTFYNWFSMPAGFVSMLANPKAKPTMQMTYYVLVSNASCPIPALDSVKITPTTLNLGLLPSDTTRICKGKSQTIQALVSPAGQPVIWSPANGLTVSPNGATAVASPNQSTLYTATATLGGCTRKRQIFVGVDSLPPGLTLSPKDTTLCQGQAVELKSTADLTGYPGITFKWTANGASAPNPDNLQNVTVQPSGNAIYRRITRNGACADTALANVKVVPQPMLTASPASSTICQGDTVGLSINYTNGLGNISWSPQAGLSCTGCDNPIAQPSQTTTYVVTGSLQNCIARDSVVLTVQPLPLLKFPSDVLLCPGDSVLLNELVDPNANYTWTSTHPGFGTVTKANPTFKPSQTATYYVTANNGCTKTDSIRVFVSTANLTAEGDTSICKNASTVLSASSNLSGSFQWRNELTGQIISTMQVVSVSPVVTTPYTILFTFGDNCQVSKSVLVQIDGELPVVNFPSDPKLCPGESLQLNTGPTLPGATYKWTASPSDPMLVDTAAAPVVMPAQNTIYSVIAQLGDCKISKNIEVTAYKATLSLTPDTTICASSPIKLTATGNSTPAGSYLWSTGSANSSINPTPTAPTTYTVTYLYGDSCSIQKNVQVNVVDNFKLNLQCIPDTNQLFVGTPVTLIVTADPPQNFSNFNLIWEETTVDTKVLPFTTESIEVVPSSNDTTVGEVFYKLSVTTPNGCLKTISKTFKLIFPNVKFPNAFTPDGDGNNETFKLVLLEGLAITDRMEIFNRWGQKIFESTDPNASWDGTSKGEPVPPDVYIYRVWWRRGDGALQTQSTGNITLLR